VARAVPTGPAACAAPRRDLDEEEQGDRAWSREPDLGARRAGRGEGARRQRRTCPGDGDATEGLPRGWQDAVLAAARSEETLLPDHLDRAIATTDLATDRGNGWWTVVRVLQWLVLLTTLVGAGWLLINFLLVSYFALPALPVPKVGNLGLPTVLALGGVGAGILVALLSRVGVEVGARSHAATGRP
jgi:hypothetical protein